MRKRIDRVDPVPTVPLTVLVAEGFSESPGALVDRLRDRGDAIGVDAEGRLCVLEPVAARLRAEKAEAQRLAAEEAARVEAARLEAVAEWEEQRRVAAVKAARDRAVRDRVARLERVTGVSIIQLERELRKSYTHRPGTAMSLDTREAWDEQSFTLDEIEAWVRDTYGPEIFEEATR